MTYYYLIATLPEIFPGGLTKDLDVSETIDLILTNITTEDKSQIRYLLHINDNINLINQLHKIKTGKQVYPEASPAYYSIPELRELLRSKYELPDYMSDFLVRFEDQFGSLPLSRIEEGLWHRFYAEVADRCNGFIKAFIYFDRALRTLVGQTNGKLFPEQKLNSQLAAGTNQEENDYEEITGHRDELLEALESKQPKFIQITMDKIRWEFCDRYEPTEFFTSNRVFAYFLQLMMTEKWVRLRKKEDPELIREKIRASIAGIDILQNRTA